MTEPLPPDAALATLVANHRRFLAFVQRRVGDRDVAEEILQDAFVKGLAQRGQLRGGESVVAWFFRVLRNAMTDRHRREAAGRRALAHAVTERAERADDAALERELCACLGDLVELLPPHHAEVIRRVDLAGTTPSAAASVFGVTAGTLRVRLHRARAALRQAVERTCRTCAEHGCLDCTCREESR